MEKRFYFKDINTKLYFYSTEELENTDVKTQIDETILLYKKKVITSDGIITKYYLSSILFEKNLTEIEISKKVFKKLKIRFLELEKKINERNILNVKFKVEIKEEGEIYYDKKLLFGEPEVKKFPLILDNDDDDQYVLLMFFKNKDSISPSPEYLEVTKEVAKYFDKNI